MRDVPLCPNCTDRSCYKCEEAMFRMIQLVNLWHLPLDDDEGFTSLYWKVQDEIHRRNTAEFAK